MAQMSSQSDTNALIAATVHGKGLKPSTTPNSGQPPAVADQRMAMTAAPPGYFSTACNTGAVHVLAVCLMEVVLALLG